MTGLAHWTNRKEMWILNLLFGLMVGLVFYRGVSITHDLEWGPNTDYYRDAGLALSIQQGNFGSDTIYEGEHSWYPPLVPTIIAAVSTVTDSPVHVVATRIGAYLNLLVPITFYAMVWYFLGQRVALAASVALLFYTSGTIHISYTPWLHPSAFAAGLFFMSLTVYRKAIDSNQLNWHILAGILLGITFLGHGAPGFMLGMIIGFSTLHRMYKLWSEELTGPELYRVFTNFVVLVSCAFVVSLPYTYYVLKYYSFHIQNRVPNNWHGAILDLPNIHLMIAEQITADTLAATIGLLTLLRMRSQPRLRIILLWWLAIAAGFTLYEYVQQIIYGVGASYTMRSVVPMQHYVSYLDALRSVLFGLGLLMGCRFLIGLFQYLRPSLFDRLGIGMRRQTVEGGLLVAFAIVLFALAYPNYRDWIHGPGSRDESLRVSEVMLDRVGAFHWVMDNTESTDVFITADAHMDMFVVAQSARKLVVAIPQYSNPYVEWDIRNQQKEALFATLRGGDYESFQSLTQETSLDYLVLSAERYDLPFLEKVYTLSELVIYRVALDES